MALTMTRTRTQTALTKLAEMVANVHGELAFLEGLLSGEAGPLQGMAPEVLVRLAARRLKLLGDRDALYATIRQFDAGIDPAGIGRSEGWRGRFGRKGLGTKGLALKYLAVPRQEVC
jgi:hypothetical protein